LKKTGYAQEFKRNRSHNAAGPGKNLSGKKTSKQFGLKNVQPRRKSRRPPKRVGAIRGELGNDK